MGDKEQKWLELDHLCAGYRSRPVIREVCLGVKKGEIISVIGPNGAGKSTILKAVSAELMLMGGSVRVLGGDVHAMSPAERAKKEAVVLTERIRPELMTVREVVEMGRYPYTDRFGHLTEEDGREVSEAIGLLNLSEIEGSDYNELSDGQKQRVLIARACAQTPDVLILDEPTSYLDVRYRLELLKALRETASRRNCAVIATLHEVELALRISDRIMCVKDGEVQYTGTPDGLRKSGILRTLFDISPDDREAETVYPWLAAKSRAGNAVRGAEGPAVMITFTERGRQTMEKLERGLKERRPGLRTVTAVRSSSAGQESVRETLTEFTGRWFGQAGALIFIGAAGIAVRAAAPFIQDKYTDPAVLVTDESGRFCIPLLSGHAGGANRLCADISEILGAVPVITTATDGRGLFSPDRFAEEQGLILRCGTADGTDGVRNAVKRISAAALADGSAGTYVFADPCPACGELRELLTGYPELRLTEKREDAEIILSFRRAAGDRADALYLIPQCLHVGIGCRRGCGAEEITSCMKSVFSSNGLFAEAAAGAASIDLKADEEGLAAFCRENGLTISVYPAELLQSLEGDFAASEFVAHVTGTDNVCERSAAASAGEGAVRIVPKTVHGRVTMAVYAGGRKGE